MIDPDNVETRFVPPPAEAVDPHSRVAAGELASRGSRLAAAAIDGLLAAALTFGMGLLWGVNLLTKTDVSLLGLLPVYLLSFAGFALVQGWPLHHRSQTLGKMAMHIRIARADGSRAGIARTLGVRLGLFWALGLLPMFGMVLLTLDLVLILRASRRCLHDLVADTVVVKA
jgi:uncharacterized RDD family membrane protein YckC